MKQINNYYLRKLEQRDLLLFFELVAEQILLIADAKFLHTLNKFLHAVDIYREILQAEAPRGLPSQLDSEERNGKSVWATIRKLTDSLMAHYGNVTRATGNKVNSILADEGSPDGLSQAWLTILFSRLIKRFESEIRRDELQRVGLLDWVLELERSNRRLLELGREHYKEATKTSPNVTIANANARSTAEKQYANVTIFINAMSIYLNDRSSHLIVDRINDIIEQAKTGTLPEPSSSASEINP
ncbi:MAG: DUF6261 family protein [Tannerellaceae bacterium]|jgi:hypothetical protein|nr:DUF6261 family protein [Tannerellaceae bacterium]